MWFSRNIPSTKSQKLRWMRCREEHSSSFFTQPQVSQTFESLGGWKLVYAKVSISGESESELITSVDREGKTNPCWNCEFIYTLAEEAVQLEEGKAILAIKLYCQRLKGLGDKYVGEVSISLKRLFHCCQSAENICFDVHRFDRDGAFGKLNISFKFGELMIVPTPSKVGKILKGALILSKLGWEVAQFFL